MLHCCPFIFRIVFASNGLSTTVAVTLACSIMFLQHRSMILHFSPVGCLTSLETDRNLWYSKIAALQLQTCWSQVQSRKWSRTSRKNLPRTGRAAGVKVGTMEALVARAKKTYNFYKDLKLKINQDLKKLLLLFIDHFSIFFVQLQVSFLQCLQRKFFLVRFVWALWDSPWAFAVLGTDQDGQRSGSEIGMTRRTGRIGRTGRMKKKVPINQFCYCCLPEKSWAVTLTLSQEFRYLTPARGIFISGIWFMKSNWKMVKKNHFTAFRLPWLKHVKAAWQLLTIQAGTMAGRVRGQASQRSQPQKSPSIFDLGPTNLETKGCHL